MNSFQYFLELTHIPRPSGKEDKVADWLVKTISKMGYKVYKDSYNNVVAFVDNGKSKTIILEAHTDMVCEVKHNTKFDFDLEPIHPYIQGDFITAQDTTLGADDGFGVALILNILDHNLKKYPNIIAVFTTQEETSMEGAKNLDFSNLNADYMIGLDGTESNNIIVSCASGLFLKFEKKLEYEILDCDTYTLSIKDCLSGHSGEEIHKNRANAIKEIFNIIKDEDIKIINALGGTRDNVIPANCTIKLATNEPIENIVEKYKSNFSNRYPEEKLANISLINNGRQKVKVINNSNDIVKYINDFDNGVLVFDKNTQLPLTSINLANIKIINDTLCINAMFRSNLKDNIEYYKALYIDKAKQYNIECVRQGYAPLYTSINNAELTKICMDTYQSLFESSPIISNMHAGLEGGIFADNIPDIQCVTLGADLYDIHTINERLKISSLTKLEKWLDAILTKISKNK